MKMATIGKTIFLPQDIDAVSRPSLLGMARLVPW